MLSTYQIYREEALGMHCLIPPIQTQQHMLHVLLTHPNWLNKAEVNFTLEQTVKARRETDLQL
jgi:hypothetical protein